jgi:hypothetical protein
MKLTYLTSLACGALLLGSAIAGAQTAPSSSSTSNSSSANQGTPDTPSSGDRTKGNNLDTTPKSPRVDPTNAPSSTGQNKSTGNNMVDANGTAAPKEHAMGQMDSTRPDFSTLDTKKTGKLSAADVKGNAWLSKNFSKCDTDHDGTVDKAEYGACH